jgi:hypothetical protein
MDPFATGHALAWPPLWPPAPARAPADAATKPPSPAGKGRRPPRRTAPALAAAPARNEAAAGASGWTLEAIVLSF